MAKELSSKQLYELIGAKIGLSPKTVGRVWNTMLDTICGELLSNDHITIDNLGRFQKVKRGGKDEWFTNEDGLQEKRYVELFDYVSFVPSKNFVNKINVGTFASGKDSILEEDDAIRATQRTDINDIVFALLEKKKK